jgi:RNA-directed DNA polymerase
LARGRGLYLQIVEPDNLRLAFRKAVRGKSDRQEVILFRHDLDDNLADLRRELLAGEVTVGPYRYFQVFDPKERTICAAPFRDRVLHHAIMNLCEPVFERHSIHDTYACRPGKGLHRALCRAQEFSRRYQWYLKLDIRKYFNSIHQETLLRHLAGCFRDSRLLRLLAGIVQSYESAPGRGLPIGNLLSQYFANFYLSRLDHWLKEVRRVPGYLRYMDDCVLFGSERGFLKSELHAIETFLAQQLRLELKDNRQLNRCDRGLPFLGVRIFPGTIRLAPRSKRRFCDKLNGYECEAAQGRLSGGELARRVVSLVTFTKAADAVGFRRSVLARRRVASEGAPTVSIVAAAGTMTRPTCGRPIATTMPRTIATITWASGLCPLQLTGVADTTR